MPVAYVVLSAMSSKQYLFNSLLQITQKIGVTFLHCLYTHRLVLWLFFRFDNVVLSFVALSKVCEKANSVKTATVDAPTWIHKYIIGKNGSNIKKITQDFSKVMSQFPINQFPFAIRYPL